MKRILTKGWILHLFNWTSNFTNKPVHLWVLLVWNQEIFLATWEIFHIKLFTKLFYEHHVCMSLLVIKLSLYNCWSNYSQGFFQEHMSKKNSLSDIVRSWCFVSNRSPTTLTYCGKQGKSENHLWISLKNR